MSKRRTCYICAGQPRDAHCELCDETEKAKTSLIKENQRIIPARFKCLACGEYHEGMSGLPCPNMTPYPQVKP